MISRYYINIKEVSTNQRLFQGLFQSQSRVLRIEIGGNQRVALSKVERAAVRAD